MLLAQRADAGYYLLLHAGRLAAADPGGSSHGLDATLEAVLTLNQQSPHAGAGVLVKRARARGLRRLPFQPHTPAGRE